MSRTSVSGNRGIGIAITLLAFALSSSAALAAGASAEARSQLAPTGKLRVALLVGVPSAVSKDGSPEEMQGVGVDMGRELARQLGVAFEPVRYKTVTELLADGKTGKWDVSPIGTSPERTSFLEFTAPYAFGGAKYLVAAGSVIKNVSDIDKAGNRILAVPQSAHEAYLSSNLRHAQLVIARGAVGLLESGKADAWFTTGAIADDWIAKNPKLRLVEGSVRLGGTALATPKGRPAAAAYVKDFVEQAKASGFVQQAIDRNGLAGASVAPPASAH